MCPILGGNWNNGTNAGVWALNLNNERGNSNNNVGFRADCVPPQGSQHERSGTEGGVFRRARPGAKSVCPLLSGSASERQERVP